MVFLWLKDLNKVVLLRLRPSKKLKKGRTQHSSTSWTTTGHKGDSSPADFSASPFSLHAPTSNPLLMQPISATREPVNLEASITVPSRSSGSVPLARKVYDMVPVALPLVRAIAGVIPLVGSPMEAAIGGLMSVLQTLNTHDQNKADLDSLTKQLNQLSCDLCNAPPACNPSEQFRRDSFVRMLQDTSTRVATLHERCFASTSVTQGIAECFNEIDRHLARYLLSSQMQIQRDIHEESRRQREANQELLIAMQSLMNRTVALAGCVILVDATGHDHAIPVNFCTSFQQLNKMLQVLFECDSVEARIQKRYVEEGQYDLCIDDGRQVTRLTSQSSIPAGTKIVMRVIFEQEMTSFSEFDYKCHFCGAVNHFPVESVMHSLERQAGCSIDCRVCKRRFQISRDPHVKQSIQSCNSNSTEASDEELRLIHNFLVQQSAVPRRNSHSHQIGTRIVSCRWLVGDNMTCVFEGTLDAFRTHVIGCHL
ncbi:uncharacterized protein F5147DRAFT_835575 [Suillus discolor]|uniref:Ubiquitin-like domain-containing protein n=1 Tax=Suillus discolor TaxID=1912936 RepID=A0A9P7FB03_9AGAM|nr:uncharacterized protein F5147DRAFT_835575 [Suillus discolor]KAG2111980.1 hypothetical protein F5147DRAFT_835575 [Suillus discolor]